MCMETYEFPSNAKAIVVCDKNIFRGVYNFFIANLCGADSKENAND